MKQFIINQEIKVKLERRPIYADPYYTPSGKESKRVLIIKEVLKPNTYIVESKGVKRQAGDISVPMTHKLFITEENFGTMYNKNTKYDVVVYAAPKEDKMDTSKLKKRLTRESDQKRAQENTLELFDSLVEQAESMIEEVKRYKRWAEQGFEGDEARNVITALSSVMDAVRNHTPRANRLPEIAAQVAKSFDFNVN